MSRSYPQSIPELRDRIEQGRQSLFTSLEPYSIESLSTIRDDAGWAAKDHVVHLAPWEQSITYLLQKRPRYEGLGITEELYLPYDVDAMNDAIFQQHRDLTWEQATAEFDRVHQAFLRQLEGMSWADLQLTYSHYAPDEPGEDNGNPVVFWVAGNTFGHYAEHQRWINELLESATTP